MAKDAAPLLCQVRKSIRKGAGKHVRYGVHFESPLDDAPRPPESPPAVPAPAAEPVAPPELFEDSDVTLFCEQLADALGGSSVIDVPCDDTPIAATRAPMFACPPHRIHATCQEQMPMTTTVTDSATAEQLLWHVVATPDMMRRFAQTVACDSRGHATVINP